jgi:hypothetical protein
MIRRLAAAAAFAALPFAATAQSDAPSPSALLTAVGIEDVLDIMREEGISYATELAGDLFPGRGGAQWSAMVERIYDREAMEEAVRSRAEPALSEAEVEELTEFFTSETGRRIVSLEISARRALLDEAVEEMSEESYAAALEEGDPRLDLLEAFVEANDLVERNVVGALNSNYAFYAGLADGGAFDFDLTEDQILRDVWGQEPEIRSDTTEWLYSYLYLAYRPLSDNELEAYIALSSSEAGQALNGALFEGFDAMFNGISAALGMAAAQFMGGQEL